MIISKDLFIFGEQIFATIIPEIGTPNSGSSGTTATTTPPTTPISPVSLTHEHEELFQQQSQHQHQQQHQHHQQLQQNPPQQAINFNAIAEVALKVAAESVEVEVEADQQVCSIKATTPTKTGTIKPISTKVTATTTSRSLSASALGLASIQATATTHETTKKNKTEEEATIPCKRSQIDSSAKKGKFSKPPREINKVNNNKTKRANDREREREQEQEQQQERINLSGRSRRRRLKRKGEVEDEVIQLFENNRKQDPTIESSSFTEDEQDIEGEGEEEEVEQIEKEPLVKRDPPIKIINGVTLPAIAKRVQGEIDDESFCLLLSNELEAQQIRQQQEQQQQQQQQQHFSNSQQTECRLQLEEPETEVLLSERFLSQVPETLTEALSPAAKIKTTSSTATNTTTATTTPTTGNKAAMGKVVLGHNNSSSSSSNNASTRNDHAMVTFPFITDFHRTLQLTFQSITVQHNERKILSDVSGIVSPGEVLAIMGPSGCGKTTLLDCLSGQRRIDSGSIYLNREPISKKWRRKICYVLQEEVFFSGLTLRETVMYTALLRLPEKMPNAEKVKLVDRILQTLELNCCQQTKFGDYLNRGLSGGEKKRANIACELLTNPLLMLLDEPTSGLDSHSAISLMKVLKRYAMQEQKTVVITVHQPSSQMFHMFDKLLLLYNGRTAYFGEVNNIYSYFEDIGVAIKPHYNPADFVLEQLKSYPDIREKLFVAAKESHGNFINRNCITLNAKQHHQKLHQQSTTTTAQTNHHNPQESNGQMKNCGQMAFNTNNTNSDKSQKHDALINNIINNYYKDITNNHHHHHHLLNHNHLNYNHHNLHHVNHDAPLLIMGGGVGGDGCDVGVGGDGGSTDDNHHDVCEDAAQQLWCATADSQSNFSSSSASSGDHQQYETDGDWLDYPTHFHTQFRVLLSRNFKEAKPLMLSKLNWLQTIGLALMAGAIWFQLPRTEEFLHDLQGWMFFSQTYWMLFALFGALNSFPAEREVISKERRSGAYRLSAYYLAKMFGELPLVITLPTVYLIISYPMLGCASFKLFFLMLVFLLLNTIVAQSVGFFIGACCMDMNVSITLSALYTLATQLFGGYLSSRIPDGLSWIRYTSMIHYAYQNMQILEFREGPTISCGSPSSFEICKNNSTSVIPYEEILKAQNSTSPLWLNTLVLMMFFLVFRVMGYAVLRYIRCPKT